MGLVEEAKAKLPALEEKLKLVSQAHQAERKDLVAVHSQLSQGLGYSQDDAGEGGGGGEASSKTESLREKLVSLSVRQKKLLQCFSKQKEITSKVTKLAEREAKAKKTSQLLKKRSVLLLLNFIFSHSGTFQVQSSSSDSSQFGEASGFVSAPTTLQQPQGAPPTTLQPQGAPPTTPSSPPTATTSLAD